MSQTSNNTIPTMLTIKDTAKTVGLSSYFIRQLILQNKIKFVRSGTKFLINFQSLLDYLNNGDVETVQQNNNFLKVKERIV